MVSTTKRVVPITADEMGNMSFEILLTAGDNWFLRTVTLQGHVDGETILRAMKGIASDRGFCSPILDISVPEGDLAFLDENNKVYAAAYWSTESEGYECDDFQFAFGSAGKEIEVDPVELDGITIEVVEPEQEDEELTTAA